jgi:molecular chaperone HtpG
VSREILQQDRHIQAMRRRLVKKVLATIKDMRAAEDSARYDKFWTEFGRVMKEGLLSDTENQESILDIASFPSTHDPDKPTSLRDYVSRMPEGQSKIYYLTGESRALIEHSPHLEAFRAKGFEVLLLTDPVDEIWVEQIHEFDGKPLQSVGKGEADLDTGGDEAAEAERDQRNKDFADLLSWMTTTLADDLKEVRLSNRLTESPACVVSDTQDATPALERMYRAMGRELPKIKRILELNPNHPLVTGLRTAHAANPDDPGLVELAQMVHGMALLAEGGDLPDPARFIRVLADRVARSL